MYLTGMPIFVKGNKYWAYSDALRSVETGYPKSFTEDFIGCEPGKLEGDGENAASSRTPTLLGVALGTLMVVFNMLF